MTQPQYAPQYPQMPQQGYPQQGYPQQPQGQPSQPLAEGSLDAFYAQPSAGGGAALKIEAGQTAVGRVSRALVNSDVQQQTQPGTGQPAFFKDGRPKYVMKVPMAVEQSEKHPDGQAQWYCAGSARDELSRAMQEAGAPAGPPEHGAVIWVTCTGTRPSGPGMNPAKVWQVRYQRPEGAANRAAAPAAPAEQPAAPAPAVAVPAQAPAPAPQVPTQAAPEPQAAPQPPAAPAPAPTASGDLTSDQQALLARLTGQSA